MLDLQTHSPRIGAEFSALSLLKPCAWGGAAYLRHDVPVCASRRGEHASMGGRQR